MITDSQGRSFKTLRVSLLPECNLACRYCSEPAARLRLLGEPDFLSPEEFIRRIVALDRQLDLGNVRLTGGEPTLYRPLQALVAGLKKEKIRKISLTTNGILFAPLARPLKAAGLDSVNISVDAISEEVFFKMSGRRGIQKTLAAVDVALAAGLQVKVNTTVMRGINDGEVFAIFDHFSKMGVPVRFLELMKMGHLDHSHGQYFVSESEITGQIAARLAIAEEKRQASATARYYTAEDGRRFGVIANHSRPFCHDCDRLRLDSQGRLFGCLSVNHGIDLAENYRNHDFLRSALQQALGQKQKEKFSGSSLSMKNVGG